MKIAVLGLWHLGCVTAACAAKHFTVTGLDFDPDNVAHLRNGKAPLFEPGLDDLIQEGIQSGRLQFTGDIPSACGTADILWVTYDTPVDDNDEADVESVLRAIRRCVPALPVGALVLLSSQLPVGTCRQLEGEFGGQGYRLACTPENLRLGKAIEIFTKADRIIAGYRDEKARAQLTELFAPFTTQVVWMRSESAEMTKHAINSFLAVSITFMNEVARICEANGADAKEVERGLKSESRIGPKAYLSPGGAFAGGTLARDVVTFSRLGEKYGESLEVLPAIKRSNDRHRRWAQEKLVKLFAGATHRKVALLGLTYKPGTNTLRRSSAIELASALHARGITVSAWDPAQPVIPPECSFIQLQADALAAADGADALVICTEWPEFRQLDWPALVGRLRQPWVLDASRFVEKATAGLTGLHYITVGSPS